MNTYFAPSGIATSLCFARAYTRTADQAVHSNINKLLVVKLVERQCLSVSSLYLGQPRGIANLGIVTDRLSY
jgi:hypothetical protein